MTPHPPVDPANDLHHRVQVGLLDALEFQLGDAGARPDAAETLARLVDFTRVHFEAEELLMKLHGYPHAAGHATAHARVLDEVRGLQLPEGAPAVSALRATLDRLRSWVVDHARTSDAAFDTWFAGRAAPPAAGKAP